jgi:nicotinamide mononucleotide transporter
MSNPIKSLTKKEWGVWIGSLLIIVISNISSGSFDLYGFISWKKREK